MHRKLPLLLAFIASLAICTFGQNNSPERVAGPNAASRLLNLEADLARILEGDDEDTTTTAIGRPRIVTIKDSAVKSAVISKAASAERIAFEAVNRKRAQMGVLPLVWSDNVAMIARLHSQNMAQFHFFSHRGLDNKMVSDRADEKGVRNWRSIGENIAYNRGFHDPITKAVDLWLDSPSHRRNMLNANWKESAIGVAIAEDGSYYFTQVFIKK